MTSRILARLALSIPASLLLAMLAGCGPKYPKCEGDDHCAEQGQVCVEGLCQQCRADDGCAAGQQCKGGRCEAKPECAAEGDCADGKVCRSGKCQVECTAEDPCGSGLKCAAGRCVAECEGPADCGDGKACVAGRCQTPVASNISRAMCELPTVRFGYNEARLDDEARAALDGVAGCLATLQGTILVEGHCDERGTEEYNLALGDRRARSVLEYLKKKGVDAGRIEVLSKGELEPVDGESSEGAWARNRRAELEAK